jgi:hypothetical protein
MMDLLTSGENVEEGVAAADQRRFSFRRGKGMRIKLVRVIVVCVRSKERVSGAEENKNQKEERGQYLRLFGDGQGLKLYRDWLGQKSLRLSHEPLLNPLAWFSQNILDQHANLHPAASCNKPLFHVHKSSNMAAVCIPYSNISGRAC